MKTTIFAALLFAVSLLPYSSQKIAWENKLKEKLVPKVSSEQAEDKLAPIELKKIPEKSANFSQTALYSNAALFVDVQSGEILYEKDSKRKLPMASTTKLMTALVAVEKLKPDEVITVPSYTTRPLDSTAGLIVGDKLTVRELLHCLLIESGADAALTFSSRISGGEHAFAALMNERAAKLGLSNTQFTNSVGYDDSGHYSTAEDLAKLAKVALSNKQVAEIVAKPSYVATSENGRGYSLSNTNKLVGTSFFKGVKTGTTFSAGECLISLYDDGTRKIIGIVLSSPSRFYETQKAIDWISSNFTF